MVRQSKLTPALISLLAGGGIAVGVYTVYQRDIQRIRANQSADSKVIQTSLGPVEYAEKGDGAPVLLIHATGGDYRQGLLMGKMFLGDGFRQIAPSRSGYLRTPQAEDPSNENQADILAGFLDALQVKKVHVVGMSAGGPVAMQLAIRHPDRSRSLVLLSTAAYAPPSSSGQRQLPAPDWFYQLIFGSDFLFWGIVRIGKSFLQAAFGATAELQDRISAEEKANLDAMIELMLPIRTHAAGLANDARNTMFTAPFALDRITAPTLVVQAADDPAAVPAGGRYTAEHISGAELVWLDDGGHVLLGHHLEIKARIREFLNTVD